MTVEKVDIIVDYREEQQAIVQKRMEQLQKIEHFNIKVEQLPVGDIYIPSKGAVIEVKEIGDWYGSILNQHIFTQCYNMTANYKNCSVIIIGTLSGLMKGMKGFNQNEFTTISHVCIGAYVSIMEKYGIKVYRAENHYEFRKIVEYIVDKANESPNPKELMRLKPTNEDRWVAILSSMCEGLGTKKAEEVAKYYPNYSVLSARVYTKKKDELIKELKEIKGIGPKLAERLCAFLYGGE